MAEPSVGWYSTTTTNSGPFRTRLQRGGACIPSQVEMDITRNLLTTRASIVGEDASVDASHIEPYLDSGLNTLIRYN